MLRSARNDVVPVGRRTAAGLLLLAVLLWGAAPVGMRYLVGTDHAGLPALAMIGLRYAIAGAIYAPFLWRARHWSNVDWRLGALCGVIGVAGYNLPSALGQRTVAAGMTGLLNGAEPLMIVIIAAIARRRLPGLWVMFAGLIGLAGIVLLAHGSLGLGDPAGIAWILTAALAWSVYCVTVPNLINRRGALAVTAVTMCAGALPLMAAGAPAAPYLVYTMTAPQWVLIAALVLGTSVISMLCWNTGCAVLGAEQAGWFLYLLPLVSLIGGAIILAEPIRPVEILGGGLILLSVFLSQR